MDALDLDALCHELLDASVESLDTLIALGLEGAPARRFVSPQQPQLECCDDGQLSVNAAAVNDMNTTPGGLAAGNRNRYGKVNVVLLLVTIARCVHVTDERGNPPTVEELNADAAQTNADVWALWNHLYDMWRAEELFSLCGNVVFEGFRPLPPSNCAGWVGSFKIRLDGYNDVP